MTKRRVINVDNKLKEKSEMFMERINSNMHFKSEFNSNVMEFGWLNEIEFACPYIDNIIRNPKVALIKEEDIVKIEKARKTGVESIKDLSKHTHFITEIDEKTNEVRPKKILITRHEETYNTYENRFIYTLIVDHLSRFIFKQEKLLEDFESKDDKSLEYVASTTAGTERVNIELKIGSKEMPKKSDNDFTSEINDIKQRVKKIRIYIAGWQKSEFLSSLENAHVRFVIPPIRKTNIILKNPNFQIAMKLWDFFQTYNTSKDSSKGGLDTTGDEILKGILDDSFLMDYFVLDSISSTKKEQKEKLSRYAVIMIKQQVQRIISLLLNSGIKITGDELLDMVANEIKNEKTEMAVGRTEVKKKFKNVIDEYLQKIKGVSR